MSTSNTTPLSGQTNPIIFFGTEDFSAASLSALIAAGFPIAAVVTKPDSKKGRGQKLVPPTVKVIAQEHNIPVWQPAKLADIADNIRALQPVAGVLVSFGKIIPAAIIELFTPGIVNVHPSHLPRYRGPSPIESAILHGDSETGVSIMQLSARMDAGPVYRFVPHTLTGSETQPELYDTLAHLGANTLVQTLPSVLDGSLQPTPQDETKATYCRLIQKSDGVLDWHKPAEQLAREIRAYQGWPGSRTTLGDIEVIITSAHAVPSDGPAGSLTLHEDTLLIHTGQGALALNHLKPVGKKEMPIQAFLAGHKDKLLLP